MSSNESPFAKYPVFQPMFDPAEDIPVPIYLTLLNLGSGSELAVAILRRILEGDTNLTPQIVALLADFNWRPQLVGAVAMGLGAANEESRDALWRAFDSGSWVSPQLAALAFLVDENFEDRSRLRMEAGCPINLDRLQGLDWVVRHSAAGPGSFASHSSKALSALAGLCQRLPEPHVWLEPLLIREDIEQSIKSDYDGGERIATGWLDMFVRLRKRP